MFLAGLSGVFCFTNATCRNRWRRIATKRTAGGFVSQPDKKNGKTKIA